MLPNNIHSGLRKNKNIYIENPENPTKPLDPFFATHSAHCTSFVCLAGGMAALALGDALRQACFTADTADIQHYLRAGADVDSSDNQVGA